MKIVIDDRIPYIRPALEALPVEAVYLPAAEMTPQAVQDADALIIRTRTRCDEALLQGSRVQFIATATIGYDHIDADYCARAGIRWCNAPGCNAPSVCQYLQSTLWLLRQSGKLPRQGGCLGVVGVGHVGTLVARMARSMGFEVLLNDPPRLAAGEDLDFRPLQQLMQQCDVLTFHVPLCTEGLYPTYHLVDEDFLNALPRRPVLINTARGEVVDNPALSRALDDGRLRAAVLDVWEHEPHIDLELMQRCFLATPHIAGYSADGKANATNQAVRALCTHFGWPVPPLAEPPAPPCPDIYATDEADACLQIYDPRQDDRRLRACSSDFERQRGNYPLRRERQAYRIHPVEG